MPSQDNAPGFRITGLKGFHMTFENGWTVSVQFGPGNYCDNYGAGIGLEEEDCGRRGSATAECAAWGPDGSMKSWFDGDTVSNRSSPAEVLALLKRASEQ